ncbi:MAG: prephenate dehydrogenase/arogenate dehydrogenase family protein [Thermoproteota archaeon]|nr:prephenate dehydrogenase/arogenate dehydrogenase family protein [Thermoproteota archaeon]
MTMTNVLIIGAAGKMGKWFFEYFNQKLVTKRLEICQVDKIFLYDIKKIEYLQNSKTQNISAVENVSESIKKSDIVIFCTPYKVIIDELNKYMSVFKPGSIVIEISSIKSKTYDIMKDIALKGDVTTLCIHPMFGPGASFTSKENNILHIPVNKDNMEKEKRYLQKIFPLYNKIIIESPGKHDLYISIIISLVYFINMVFSKFLASLSEMKELGNEKISIKTLKKISGNTFKMQSLLSESILTDDLSLFTTLLLNNDKTLVVAKSYEKILNQLLTQIERKDQAFLNNLLLSVRKEIGKQVDIEKSYKRLYDFLNFQGSFNDDCDYSN